MTAQRVEKPSDAAELSSGVFARKTTIDAFALHDAKNLLGAIFANLDWLKQTCDDGRNPESLEAVADLTQACRQLEALLVEGLVARQVPVGTLSVKRRRTPIAALVDAAVRRIDKRARLSGLRIAVTGVPSLQASIDPDLVSRVLDNLLDNALRVSPTGSTVSVHYGDSGGDLLLTICDQGPGVPTEERNRIFEIFSASPTRHGNRGTAGMGLAFCQKVAEAHGGRVILDDRGAGACFVVTLPLFG